MSKVDMQSLKYHLFDTIERLKDRDNPDTDPKDTISLESAREIARVAKVIVDINKNEISAIQILANADNPLSAKNAFGAAGILEEKPGHNILQ